MRERPDVSLKSLFQTCVIALNVVVTLDLWNWEPLQAHCTTGEADSSSCEGSVIICVHVKTRCKRPDEFCETTVSEQPLVMNIQPPGGDADVLASLSEPWCR